MSLFIALSTYFLLYTLAYIGLLFFFPLFFQQSLPKLNVRSLYSVLGICAVWIFFFAISEIVGVSFEEWGNRILHAMAGGFTALLMCYVALRDSKVVITRFQFTILSFLLVTALGVGNEIAEFFGQYYTDLVFAPTINDTWLDLISNTVGALLGIAVSMPFLAWSFNTDDVIWVDEQDHELGVIPIQKAHREGLLHRIVVVYLTRKNGDILIQERISGRLDHSSAGHVDIGEDYLHAAQRELKEELGIECPLIELGKTVADAVEPEADRNRIRHIFKVFECQAEPGTLAPGEVKSVFWADPKAIYEEMKSDTGNNKFCGGFKASLKFFLEKKYGRC